MFKRFMRKIESLGWRKQAAPPSSLAGDSPAQKTTPFTQITPPQQPVESRPVPAAPAPAQPAGNPSDVIHNWVKANYAKPGVMPNLSWIKTPDLRAYLRHFIEEQFKATGQPSANQVVENIRQQVPLTPVNVPPHQATPPQPQPQSQPPMPVEQSAQPKHDLGPLEALPDYFNVGMDNVEDVAEKGQKKEEVLSPEQQAMYKQRMEASRGFINSFLQMHGGLLQGVAGKAISFGKDPAAVEDALQTFKMNFLGPPKKFTNQDNRLVLLTKPDTQAALMQVEPFASRVRSKGLSEQQMLTLAGNTQGQYQALGDLLVESKPGAHDSLPDALNQVVAQGQMPDAFRKFYLGALKNLIQGQTAGDGRQARTLNPLELLTDSQTLNYILAKDKKFAARLKSTGLTVDELTKLKGADEKTLNSRLRQIVDDTYPGAYDGLKSALEGLKLEDDLPEKISRYLKQSEQGGMRGTTSINQSVGSDDGSPEMGDMLGQNQRSDMAQDTNQQIAAYFGQAQKIIQGKLTPVKKMTDHIIDVFDQYAQWEGADDARLNVPSTGGSVYVPDLLQVYMNAAQQQIKNLVRPGVNKDKQEAFRKIQREQAAQGRPMQFSTKGGKLQLVPPQVKTDSDGNPKVNLEDIGFDVSKLVQSQSLQANFGQLAYIKRRARRLAQQGIANPSDIANRIKAEFQARNYPLSFSITPGFVQNSLKEPEESIQTLEHLAKNGGAASEVANQGKWKMWQSMFPFVFQMVEGYPPEVRRLFFDIIGVHRRYVEPVNKNFHGEMANIPPQLMEGKKWFEMGLDQIQDRAYPIDPNSAPEQQQVQMKKRKDLERAMRGYTKVGNIEQLWKWFMNEPMPPQVQEWLQWAKAHKGKERATKGYGWQVPEDKRQARQASLLRRMWAAYDRHEERLGRLISAKRHLLKVASSEGLDDLLSRAKLEAFNELLILSRLV
jgi:hypothetical protein